MGRSISFSSSFVQGDTKTAGIFQRKETSGGRGVDSTAPYVYSTPVLKLIFEWHHKRLGLIMCSKLRMVKETEKP